MIKKFNEFINESLRDKMKGKTHDEIVKNFNKIKDDDKKNWLKNWLYSLARRTDGEKILLELFEGLKNDEINIHWTILSDFLLTCVYFNYYHLSKKIIETGNVDLESTDFNGNTPLLIASKNGNKKMVELLVENGANIEHYNNNRQNAFDIAIFNNNTQIAIYLLKYKQNNKL